MALTDPLGDMLTRIRSGQPREGQRPFARSKLRANVLEVLSAKATSAATEDASASTALRID